MSTVLNAVARFRRLSRRQQGGAAAGAVAAAIVVAVVAAAVASAGGKQPSVATATSTRSAAATPKVTPATVTQPAPSSVVAVITDPPPTLPLVASGPPVPTTARSTTPSTAPVTVTATTVPATATTAPIVAVGPPPTIATTTTAVPVVPQVAITSTQVGPAVIGGQARVQVAVSASAPQASQLRTTAFDDLVVFVALPAGVSVASADNPTWACIASGSCTVSSLVDSSTAVLTLRIETNASPAITFAPTITTPANAVVQAPPITIVAAKVPGLMFQEFGRGSVAAIGNTVMDCDARGCTDIDVIDDGTATFNSSTADLSVTGTVRSAFLVWSGNSSKSRSPRDRDKVQFFTPTGVLDLVADHVVTTSPSSPDDYVAYMDVTGWMASLNGTFGVGNIQTSDFGGWSLFVVSSDDTQPERSLSVSMPVNYVSNTSPSQLVLTGASPLSTADAHVVVSAFEGDEKPHVGDTVKLNGVDLTGGDAFGGRIAGVPRQPQKLVSYEVDLLDVQAIDIGQGDVTIDFATSGDPVMIAAVGLSVDLS